MIGNQSVISIMVNITKDTVATWKIINIYIYIYIESKGPRMELLRSPIKITSKPKVTEHL